MSNATSELIRLAARLATGQLLPGIDTERWYRSTPMAERRQIIKALEDAWNEHRRVAMQLRAIADALPVETEASPSTQCPACGLNRGACMC